MDPRVLATSRGFRDTLDLERSCRAVDPVKIVTNSLFRKLINVRDAGEGDFTAGERLAL